MLLVLSRGSWQDQVMASFKESLLSVMDQKNHWGWQFISGPDLKKQQLLVHFQQEFEVYVRDFPVFLARIMGRMEEGSPQLKRELAENLYEEQTGGISQKISKGQSHPDLFLKMMKGLGYSHNKFENIDLLPTSLAYRCFLDKVTLIDDWRVGAAIMTLFVEGSVHDRARCQNKYKEKLTIQQKMKQHALVKYYGLKTADADLIKVHHAVEGDHRKSAWETILKAIPKNLQPLIHQRMCEALELWLLYRDGICIEMGLQNPDWH